MNNMKSEIFELFQTAIGAVDPYTCVKNYLVFNNKYSNKQLYVGNNYITLNHNLYVAAFGKAALGTREFTFLMIEYFSHSC